MAITSPFHPYKVIEQGRSTLTLASSVSKNTQLLILLVVPLVSIATAIAVFRVTKNTILLYVFAGVVILEFIAGSFIKIPVTVQLDSMGLNIETASLKGFQQTYYLWNDVEHLRYRIVRTKEITMLVYDAILKNGKKERLLAFNYNAKKPQVEEINTILTAISKKEIRAK